MIQFPHAHILHIVDADIYQKRQKILSQINLTIDKGEFVYLIGKTGSGKSSLLKTLYADLPLQTGSIEIVGFQLNGIYRKHIPFLRRKMGIIFQDFQLFPDRTVQDNLLFVLQATGWTDSSKIKKRIADVLAQVGLYQHSFKQPHQLSGGEQQRLVIARALLNEPFILIADEPTGNLDPETSEDILKLFLQINKSGTAVLMATHNHLLIEKYPQRTLICHNGRVTDF